MAGLKWNTGKLYYSTVELGYQQAIKLIAYHSTFYPPFFAFSHKYITPHHTVPYPCVGWIKLIIKHLDQA